MSVRPRIAFFDFPDVFEDFYPHYGVDQKTFASTWSGSANHAILALLQREVGDVSWYELSLDPAADAPKRHALGFEVRLIRSSGAHRLLWWAFYRAGISWRWPSAYRGYATAASYLAPLSPALLLRVFREQPDVVFAQSYKSGKFDVLLALARRLDVPLVAYHAGGAPDAYVGTAIRRHSLPRADVLIASSAAEREFLITRFGVAPERIRVALVPIDTAVFRPLGREQACHAAGLDPGGRYFLYVGRLSREKRVDALIEAFGRIAPTNDEIQLVIAGDGPEAERLRARSQELAPRQVRFMGWMPRASRLVNLYNAADCLVLPSRWEGAPAVVGESMACGTPVLASRVGGVPDQVSEARNGWLVEPGDDDALKERLAHVAAHPAELPRMRLAARQAAEERVSPLVVGAQLRESFATALSA